MLIDLKRFSEDYAPLLLRLYPKSVELMLSIMSFANDDMVLPDSLSSVNKRIYDRRSSWNTTDKKARDMLVHVGVISIDETGVRFSAKALSARERMELYRSNGMYDTLIEVLEDDILRRRAYKEAIADNLSSKIRTDAIVKMGLKVKDVSEALSSLKEVDRKRYDDLVGKINRDEKTIQSSMSRMKVFKGSPSTPQQEVIIPTGVDLTTISGLNGYRIPETVSYVESSNSYLYEADIDYCRERGHLDRDDNAIPIEKWGPFQFIKLFLDEFHARFGFDYPNESNGVLIYKELDAPESLRKGKSVWKKKGQKIARIFKDVQAVATNLKDKQSTRDYIRWWFSSGIVDAKNAEYTSGWLRSSLMLTAFMKERSSGSRNNKRGLTSDIIERIIAIEGFVEANHNRIPESINDIRLLEEQVEFVDIDDPRKKAVEICKQEGVI